MVDLKTRKALFNDYRKCKLMVVNNQCKVIRTENILISNVSVDEDGRVYIEWRYDQVSKLQWSEVNMVDSACEYMFIQGIFTSKKEAIAVAKDWFKTEKKERIVKLETELAELKKDM